MHQLGKLDEAAFLYENLLGVVPDDAVVLYLFGTLYSQQDKFGTAITLLRSAVEINPAMAECWHNLGVAYRNEGHVEKARNCYQKGIEICPDNPAAMAMMAGSYVNAGEPLKGVEWSNKALKFDPDDCHAQNQKALCLLELGRFEEAWPIYNGRFAQPSLDCSVRPFQCGLWDGSHVKKLAIHGEQGLGDEILFMSCFGDLVLEGPDRVADEVIVECQPRLISLFERSFGVTCYGTHDEMIAAEKDIDAYIPMGHMPSLCRNKAEDFPRKAFLKPKKSRVTHYRKRLKKLGKGPHIGIAWHGGTKHTHQELRNPLLELWQSLVEATREIRPATFVSLQYGVQAKDQAKQIGIPHWPKAVDDLEDHAALIAALDVVISVCQTSIHFAGAVGTECWCLTPSEPAWRYGVEGPMLWYGSVDLIRQEGKEWLPSFEELGGRIADLP